MDPSLLCVAFSYQLNNLQGLTPEDILTETGNTLKTGLELAGRNITIELLNSTFPGGSASNLVEESETMSTEATQGFTVKSLGQRHKRRYSHAGEGDNRVRKLEGYETAIELGISSTFGPDQAFVILDSAMDIWLPRIPTVEEMQRRSLRVDGRYRRLVFYTDAYPSEVRNVIENFNCESTLPNAICVIVQQRSCVFVEEGDDPELVRFTLRNGFRNAINSGQFADAIPPEHIPQRQ